MKNSVTYHNDINKIPLRNFSEKEINIFFSLLFKLKDKEENKVNIKFLELRKISNGDIHSERFFKSVKSLSKKLLTIHIEEILDNEDVSIFNIFNEFTISSKKKEVTVQVNERFRYMLNNLLKHFTKFELQQLVSFKSSYSKNIFRQLKQYESTRFFTMKLEEFRRIMCIPETYKMCDIDKWVLKPAMKELTPFFYNLKLEKIKKGRKIEKLNFTWQVQKSLKSVDMKVKISKNLSEYIEIIKKKNRYISIFLTPANIDLLLKDYNEEELIGGLKFAKNQIQKEIKSINYLKKVIKTWVEASKKVFDIENEIDEIEDAKIVDEVEVIDESSNIDALSLMKAELVKWCMKNKKLSLLREIDNIKNIENADEYMTKYSIEI